MLHYLGIAVALLPLTAPKKTVAPVRSAGMRQGVMWYPKDRFVGFTIVDEQGVLRPEIKKFFKAREVIPGTFFYRPLQNGKRIYRAVDWVRKDGHDVVPRNSQLHRPAFVELKDGTTRIEYQAAQLQRTEQYRSAAAGACVMPEVGKPMLPPDPNEARNRHVLVVEKDWYGTLKAPGTARAIYRTLRHAHVNPHNAMHSDGGHTASNAAVIGVCIVIVERKNFDPKRIVEFYRLRQIRFARR